MLVMLFFFVDKAHIARQSVAIDLYIAAVGTLQRHFSQTTVYHLELRQFTVVASVAIMEHTVLGGYSRQARCFVDDADCLTVGDVLAAVSHRLLNGKVVEFGIATLHTFLIKGKEGVARSLESGELVAEWHHAA